MSNYMYISLVDHATSKLPSVRCVKPDSQVQ